ncbi:MAG: preprotein translocase subunit YajC [Clostridia bacterium]|jgi:preprotein translocase subunit YajC|nr:preprotein translocase subunit YajC [Clostridia bacterium]
MAEFFTQYGTLLFMIILMVVMYLIMFRPQKKREKEIKQMRNNLEVGDMVVTESGIVGKVISTKDIDTVTIETGADKTKLKFKRWAIISKEQQ